MYMYMDTHNVHYNIIETICSGLRVRKKNCSNYLREVKPSLVAAISFRAPKACSAHISHLSPSGLEIRRRASRLC